MSVELIFSLDDIKPVSVNEMYSYGRRMVRKSKKYIEYSELFLLMSKKLVKSSDILEYRNYLLSNDQYAIFVDYTFHIPLRSYFKADTSNYIKSTEDILKELINIDDSRNVKFTANKVLSTDKKWHISIKMSIYLLEYTIPEGKWSTTILGAFGHSGKKSFSVKSTQKKTARRKRAETKTSVMRSIVITDSLSSMVKTLKVEQTYLFD